MTRVFILDAASVEPPRNLLVNLLPARISLSDSILLLLIPSIKAMNSENRFPVPCIIVRLGNVFNWIESANKNFYCFSNWIGFGETEEKKNQIVRWSENGQE